MWLGWQKGGSSVRHLLSNGETEESSLSGRITKDILAETMPGPGSVLVLVCGPPGFGNVVAKYLVQLGSFFFPPFSRIPHFLCFHFFFGVGYTEAMFYMFA